MQYQTYRTLCLVSILFLILGLALVGLPVSFSVRAIGPTSTNDAAHNQHTNPWSSLFDWLPSSPLPATPALTFTVTSVRNIVVGTLRQTIIAANANAGADTIVFNISGPGVRTINITSALPAITDPVTIDGTTEPGFAGSPLIEINGGLTSADGLNITAGNCT